MDRRHRRERVLGGRAGDVDERALDATVLVLDAVAAEVGELAQAGLRHLLADEAAAVGGDAAVEHRIRAEVLELGQDRQEVRGSSGPRPRGRRPCRRASRTRRRTRRRCRSRTLSVVDDCDAPEAQVLVGVLRDGRTLDVVRGRGADIGDLVRVLRPQLLAGVTLGQVRVGVGRIAPDQTGFVGDRDLDLGHRGVERPDDGHDSRCPRRMPSCPWRPAGHRYWPLTAVDGRSLDRVALDGAGRVGLLDGQERTIARRTGPLARELPLQRERDPDLENLAAAARATARGPRWPQPRWPQPHARTS